MLFPGYCRVQYHMYFTSTQADQTFSLSSGRLPGHLEGKYLEMYCDNGAQEVIEYLNYNQGVTDFRLMDGREVEAYIRGFHKHSIIRPEEQDVDVGLRH